MISIRPGSWRARARTGNDTSFSFGIDDQDFVVAFDSDYPQEFVDLVGRLRYTEASLYTQRDTPMFPCAKAPIDAILAQLANIE